MGRSIRSSHPDVKLCGGSHVSSSGPYPAHRTRYFRRSPDPLASKIDSTTSAGSGARASDAGFFMAAAAAAVPLCFGRAGGEWGRGRGKRVACAACDRHSPKHAQPSPNAKRVLGTPPAYMPVPLRRAQQAFAALACAPLRVPHRAGWASRGQRGVASSSQI